MPDDSEGDFLPTFIEGCQENLPLLDAAHRIAAGPEASTGQQFRGDSAEGSNGIVLAVRGPWMEIC